MTFNESDVNREADGKFGEKVGSAPETTLAGPMAQVADIRERYDHMLGAEWHHTDGDVWCAETISDPDDPTGQTPMQQQILIAQSDPQTAEYIAAMRNDVQTLLQAIEQLQTVPAEYRVQ